MAKRESQGLGQESEGVSVGIIEFVREQGYSNLCDLWKDEPQRTQRTREEEKREFYNFTTDLGDRCSHLLCTQQLHSPTLSIPNPEEEERIFSSPACKVRSEVTAFKGKPHIRPLPVRGLNLAQLRLRCSYGDAVGWAIQHNPARFPV